MTITAWTEVRERSSISRPLHPLATDLDLLAEHLEALRRGEMIDKHIVGAIAGTSLFGPAPVIIVEGCIHFPRATEKPH